MAQSWRHVSGCPRMPNANPSPPCWNICPTAKVTARPCATPFATPTWPGTATPPSAWTCAAAATPTVFCTTNTCGKNRMTRWNCWPGSPTKTGATAVSACSANRGAALTACKSPPATHRSSKPSSPCTSPMTATPTTYTTWAAVCSVHKCSPGRPPCLCITPCRPTHVGWAKNGVTCGKPASPKRPLTSRNGCATNGATPTGNTAPFAKIIAPSNAPSTLSAAGPTPTPTPCLACWPG